MTAVARHTKSQPPDRSDYSPERMRLLIVDDHPAVRAGLQQLLDDQADFDVVAAAATAEDALAIAESDPIDVAVVDYQLGGKNGLWVSRKLKRLAPPPGVVIYSAYTDGVLASAAVVAEADAIVSKGCLGVELCEAIRKVARGHQLLPPVPEWLGDALRRRLDDQEQAIFGLLIAGIKTPEIASTLGLPEAAIESRLWSMLRKLEAVDAISNARSRAADVVGNHSNGRVLPR
ncbi:MAG: response regulator transcription factor [Solirubrobacteraceae bacterium]